MHIDLNQLQYWATVIRPVSLILVVWLGAWLLLRLIPKTLRLLKQHLAGKVDVQRDFRRIETLTNVFRYTANVLIVGIAIMLTLGEIGISIAPLLATAGVAGIAVGFGAQSLVKDFFSGLFLLIENQISEGDIIEVAGKNGYVERVTLRHVRIRDYDGSLHFIPNGMITTVTNKSREFAYAVIDYPVKRDADIDRIFDLMQQVSKSLRDSPELAAVILNDIDIAGVEKIEDAGLVIRCRIKVVPPKQWRVRREFLQRMQALTDVKAPSPV